MPGGNGNDIDDFPETVVQTGITVNGHPLYEVRDCDPTEDGVQPSPRVGSIFILPTNPNGNNNRPDPIIGFAGFYLSGCSTSTTVPPSSPGQRKCEVGNPGQQNVWGIFVNLTTTGGGVGPPNPASTLFGIGLVE
jgi:hypothetical protein